MIKQIPYGLTDFGRIQKENYYYVDKTMFIEKIEMQPSYLFLIRPRRFGKSLTLAMLEAYYDVRYADQFDELFGHLYIGQHPTPIHNQFLIMRFNFSEVSSNVNEVEESFRLHCCGKLSDFVYRYEHLLGKDIWNVLDEKTQADPGAFLSSINTYATRKGDLKIYLLIDEYDNFTNTILSTYGTDLYRKATHGEGYIRRFFNVIKAATTGMGSAVNRLFITGVSPVTMDDVTSGFNIGTNITTDPWFNDLVGFSEKELREMLTYYKEQGALPMSVDDAVTMMKPNYDNYCFSENKLADCMFNSDMVLYFLSTFLRLGTPPKEMIDRNIRTDYNKIRHLIRIDRELGANFSIIREIVENGRTTANINSSFPADRMVDTNNFKSLLYYFGLLTISGTERGNVVLTIPNQTVREQLYTYLVDTYHQAELFAVDLNKLNNLMAGMAYDGDWQPVFTYIGEELKRQSRIREFIDGEAHVKGFLLAYLGLTNYYYLQPEYESGKGYADFYFRPNPSVTGIPYLYLLEVKYAKASDPADKEQELMTEARTQLLQYAADPIVTQSIGTAKLRLITVVFRTWEVVAMEEVEEIE